MGTLHEVPLQLPEMTTGPLRLGAGFIVFTHRVFQGQVIWGHLESYLLVLARTPPTAISRLRCYRTRIGVASLGH